MNCTAFYSIYRLGVLQKSFHSPNSERCRVNVVTRICETLHNDWYFTQHLHRSWKVSKNKVKIK